MMVTTIGFDPHEATHTAVVVDDDETVLAEINIRADKDQTTKLIDWAGSVDGAGWVWAEVLSPRERYLSCALG